MHYIIEIQIYVRKIHDINIETKHDLQNVLKNNNVEYKAVYLVSLRSRLCVRIE